MARLISKASGQARFHSAALGKIALSKAASGLTEIIVVEVVGNRAVYRLELSRDEAEEISAFAREDSAA